MFSSFLEQTERLLTIILFLYYNWSFIRVVIRCQPKISYYLWWCYKTIHGYVISSTEVHHELTIEKPTLKVRNVDAVHTLKSS